MRAVAVTHVSRLVPTGPVPLPEELVATGLTALHTVVGPVLDGLRRRRDRKLFARATELALAAAADLPDEHAPVGLFLAVGREPPEPQTEDALLAAAAEGRLDPDLLASEAIPRYPPLASLRTLPNLALAHVAIQRQLDGPAESWAGEEAAGLYAVLQAFHAVASGRVEVAWAGGADSRVAPALARDLVRRGLADREHAPGEGAAWLRLVPLSAVRTPLAVLTGGTSGFGGVPVWRSPEQCRTGSLGAAAAPAWLASRMGQGGGQLRVGEDSGAWTHLGWEGSGRPRGTVSIGGEGSRIVEQV